MKTISILIIATIILAACNNNNNHDGHADTANQSSQAINENGMKKMMDDMMADMHHAKPTNNNDVDFAVMMTAHHKGAVAMSELLLRTGKDSSLKQFADQVIAAQEKEISFMEKFIAKNDKKTSADAAAFQESMAAMMKESPELYNQPDKDFAARMIPHHQSAVDMAKAYQQYGKDESLLKMCRAIIDSQSAEIKWLQSWLDARK